MDPHQREGGPDETSWLLGVDWCCSVRLFGEMWFGVGGIEVGKRQNRC